MNILSLFGGIETGRLIAERLGWKVDNYFSSEIDSYPIMATKKNWPDVVHVGSVTETFYQNGELHYYDGKGFQRSKGYINLLLAGSPCFVKGSKVRTETGYEDISEIIEGTKVLTHNGKFERVLRVGGKTAETRFIKGMGFEIETTDEHPFFIREMKKVWNNKIRRYERKFSEPIWKLAKDLKKTDYILIVKNKKEYSVSDSMAYFWGRYAGDGWYNEDKNCVIVCDGYSKEEDMNNLMNDTGYHYFKNRERTTIKYCIYDKKLMEKAMKFGKGASNKKIPDFVFEYSKESKMDFIRGYLDSDGCKKSGDIYDITSISHEIIIGTQSLVQECYGIPTRYHFTKRCPTTVIEGRTVNQKDSHNIRFKFDIRKQDKAFSDSWGSWQPVKLNEPTGRIEQVYNIEVENDNSYTVHNVAVHNCQDLSIAKNDGKGLEGDRSKLFYEFVRLLRETNPKHFFLENVASMKAIWRDEMTKVIGEALYGTCLGKSPNYDTSKQKKLYNYYPLTFQHPSGWITEFGPWMLNAGMVSAQNRKRLYWTDIKFSLSDVQELASHYDESLKLKDILEDISFDALDAKGNPIWKPLDEKYLKTLKQNENCMYELNSVGSLRQGYEMFKEDGKTYGISSSHAPNTRVVVQIPEATSKGYCEPIPGNVVDMTQPESSTPRGRLMTDKANTCMTGQNMMLIGEVNGGGQGNRIYSTDGKSATLSAQCGGAAGASSNLICGQFRRTDLRVHADQEKICTLTSNMGTGGNNVPILISENQIDNYRNKEKADSLTASYGGAVWWNSIQKSQRTVLIEKNEVQYVWRKLTVTECCRLQGLPDNYLSMLSNARAYKAAGNGWQADMVEWMLKFAKF